MLKNNIILIAFFLGFPTSLLYGQFTANGDASQTSCNCFEITANSPNLNGSFFSNNTINLTNPFDFTFTTFFGCDDLGGEGMTFMLQPINSTQLGTGPGYQLAAAGINPSLLIEFDTRNNGTVTGTGQVNNGDISADHLDILTNGSTNHNTNSLIPGPPIPLPNLENCQNHQIRITWDPGTTTLEVYHNDLVTPITTLNNDIINNVLGGNPNVYWGWTGATGALPNLQTVCLSLDASFITSAATCEGVPVNFTADVTSFYPVVSYSWDFEANGTIDATGVNATYTFGAAGLYDVVLIIQDNQGCTVSDTINFGVGFELDINTTNTNVCPGATINLEADPTPYIANQCLFNLIIGDTWGDGWAGNNLDIFENGVLIGTYAASNFGGGGGSPTETFQLFFNQGSTVELCFNANNPFGSLGEIFYSIADENGNVLINVPPGTVNTSTGCSDFIVNCGLTPPTYTYSWTTTSGPGTIGNPSIVNPNVTVPGTSTFEVTAEDMSSGCTSTESITITVEPPVTAEISGNETICNGDNASLTVTFTGNPPYQFTYNSGGAPIGPVTGINTSPYTLTVTNGGTYSLNTVTGNGCSGTVSGSATVTVINLPNVTIAPGGTYCDGQPIPNLTVTSSNGGTVSWYDNNGLNPLLGSGNSFSPPPLGVGSHTFYAQEEESVLGCTGSVAQTTIFINPIPSVPAIAGDNLICDGDLIPQLTVTGSASATFQWFDGGGNPVGTGNTFTPGVLNVGVNTFTAIQIVNGCPSNPVSFSINVTPTPGSISLGTDTTYCEGETISDINVTPTIGGNMIWSSDPSGTNIIFGGNPFSPPNVVGVNTYYAFETLNGCDGPISEVTITINEAPAVLLPDTVDVCIGDSIQLFAENNGYELLWNTGDTLASIWVTPSVTTTYSITTTNNCGTSNSQTVVVVNSLPTIFTSNDVTTGLGADLILSAFGGVTFEWQPDIGECRNASCSNYYFIPTETTTFVVFGTNAIGCINSDTIRVTINGEMEVFVPNIFSPNNDGWNDELEIKGPKLTNFSIIIFDRWGNLVFESDEQNFRWDGRKNDNPVEEGVYVYMLKGTTLLGKEINKNGNVMVTR